MIDEIIAHLLTASLACPLSPAPRYCPTSVALAIPIAILVFFVLGLTFWIGYTIATIRVEPGHEPADDPQPPSSSDHSPDEQS